ncbi:hypothetical protein [Pedobacter duraquae]|uniref:YD repeat-containing protein n=1 Tax=Pedobacter duraquae TaxID=425511 RepID=A0A4R6ICR5_9SPHI|nr:hypothetical protein [Pedobacter duraquae]TDO19377.1 hypothetical protein CLV32_4617 [Pedobacter duraquae]
MKRLFLGLLVAGVAMGGSAFTNAKKANIAYITGQSTSGGVTTYSYDNDDLRTCDSPTALPCTVQAQAGYSFTTPTGTISQADLNDNSKVIVQSRQTSYNP